MASPGLKLFFFIYIYIYIYIYISIDRNYVSPDEGEAKSKIRSRPDRKPVTIDAVS